MTRIDKKFQELKAANRKAFIPYITAGDPDLKTSADLILALDRAGADIIEVGVPFSDPIADGPVIQRATERALASHTTLRDILQLGVQIRKTSEVPMLIMSYYNPLLHYGLEKLAHDAAASGFDGILASDLTVEESGPFLEAMKRSGIEHGVSCSSDKFAGTDSQDRRNFHGVSLCCLANGRYRRASGTLNRASRLSANSSKLHAGADCGGLWNIAGRSMSRQCGRRQTALWLEARWSVRSKSTRLAEMLQIELLCSHVG